MAERAGWLKVDYDLLREQLGLPPEIRVARVEPQEWNDCRVLLRGPGLPEVGEEGKIAEVTAEIHTEQVTWTFTPREG